MHNSETSSDVERPEPWVDMKVVSQHLGLHYQTITKLAKQGRIPAWLRKIGHRSYWRFKISAVDAALIAESANQSKDGKRALVEKPLK